MHAIEVRDLTVRYGTRTAADDIDLTVDRGEIVGLLGPNGAGKTTVVETVAGLRAPHRGRVRVLDLDPRRDRARLRRVLGAQLQASALHSSLTVRELVRLHRSLHPDGHDPDRMIAALGLEEQAATRFEKLSGGQAQRLSIAVALIGAPRVALLDELTTGLDPRARREVWALVERLRADGTTVLLVSHLMEEVDRLCDRVVVLDRGRVVARDTPAGLVERTCPGRRVRWRTAEPLDPGTVTTLERLPGISSVEVTGERLTVTGEGDPLRTVGAALVRAGVVTVETREERPGLDDAFLALTGRPLTVTPGTVDPNPAGEDR
ncbi:ABC transporter ATP-binding protein [Streptomyces calidiresistens]|uniref:ABC transporter ATP-binding protein n=1 Tax=Streptomyces calidiresistens TaxID=1485586 RepID=UPI002B21230A|nr:ABC transporter ATP-binding protein [Streptomyces calidiresistens]